MKLLFAWKCFIKQCVPAFMSIAQVFVWFAPIMDGERSGSMTNGSIVINLNRVLLVLLTELPVCLMKEPRSKRQHPSILPSSRGLYGRGTPKGVRSIVLPP